MSTALRAATSIVSPSRSRSGASGSAVSIRTRVRTCGGGSRKVEAFAGRVEQQRQRRDRAARSSARGAAQDDHALVRIVPCVDRDRLALLVEPGDVGDARRRLLLAVHEMRGSAAPDARGAAPSSRADEMRCERLPFGRGRLLPVEPGQLVVLAIGVVVAALACGRIRRRRAASACRARKNASPASRADEARARVEDCRIVGRPFDAPVGGVIVAVAVLVVLAVGLVVRCVVAHRVGQA